MSAQLETLDFAAMNAAEEGERVLSKEEEWLKQRWGKFTASEMHRLMTNMSKPNELPKGAVTYAQEKAVELLTEFNPDYYVSYDMQWGIDHELEAIERFEKETGLDCVATGDDQVFLESDCGDWGGTPDGLISSSGIEVKCPKSVTHLKYRDISDAETLKEASQAYYWQCMALMLLNDSTVWHFVSYDPRFDKNKDNQIHIVDILINQADIALMLNRLRLAIDYRNRIVEGML